jgi:hypothetical protein
LLPRAADLIALLRRSKSRLKVIAAVEVEGQTCNLPGVDRSLLKPVCAEEAQRLKWLETIQELLKLDSATQ